MAKPRSAHSVRYRSSLIGPPPQGVELRCRDTMKTRTREVVYRGIWPGLGEMYNVKVETGYTTILVKPGEDLKKRAKETQERFVRKDIAIPASARSCR
jgi:hypothetical protein